MKVLVNLLEWDTQTDHVVKTSHVSYVLCKQYGFRTHRFFLPAYFPPFLLWISSGRSKFGTKIKAYHRTTVPC